MNLQQTTTTAPQPQWQPILVVMQQTQPYHVFIYATPDAIDDVTIDYREASLFTDVFDALVDNRKRLLEAKARGRHIDTSDYMPKGMGRFAMCAGKRKYGYQFDPGRYAATQLKADWPRIIAGLKRDLQFQRRED